VDAVAALGWFVCKESDFSRSDFSGQSCFPQCVQGLTDKENTGGNQQRKTVTKKSWKTFKSSKYACVFQ